MNVTLIIAGTLIVVATMFDAFWTTVGFAGGGPLTRRLARAMWASVLRIHQARSGGCHALLKATGTVILLTTVLVWIVAVFLGYLLIFTADGGAVVHGATGEEADLAERIYFTGYTLFTLGLGDFVPGGDAWRIATVIATLNGLFLVTLAITYLIPVVSAAAEKHQLGAAVSNLGTSPSEIVARAWDGESFGGISTHLVQLAQMIDIHAQRHLAYPVLHYFHSVERRTAVAPSLATLHDSLLILSAGVEKEHRLPAIAIEPVQRALDGLVAILRSDYVEEAASPPPPPDLTRLREGRIPVVGDAEFKDAIKVHEQRRTLLKAYVENGGWTWEDVRDSR